MKVINLFGGAGVGKSTLAAGLFHHMKCNGYDVELVTEYAKDMVYEQRTNIMEDQVYIHAKQYRRVSKLIGKVEYVVTDSPILLSAAYTTDGYFKSLEPLIFETFTSFDNINFVIVRPNEAYNQNGRIQNELEALEKDRVVLELLKKTKQPYTLINSRQPDTIQQLFEHIL
jgi:deoxyadenosine/deoxycytidine kinase